MNFGDELRGLVKKFERREQAKRRLARKLFKKKAENILKGVKKECHKAAQKGQRYIEVYYTSSSEIVKGPDAMYVPNNYSVSKFIFIGLQEMGLSPRLKPNYSSLPGRFIIVAHW